MMKFEYPTIEIEKFQMTDVITTSSCDDDELPPSPCSYVI